MSTFYSDLQGVAAGILSEFKQGTILLTRNVETLVDEDKPWGDSTIVETPYELDAAVQGVNSKYVDGKLVLASDLQVVCSVIARNTVTEERGAIEPVMSDLLTVDGTPHKVKLIKKLPAAGTPVSFIIFVEG